MHIIRSSIAAAALLVVAVTPVLADHGYWPEAGVVPAAVSEHRPYSEVAATPAFWGADCRGLAQTGEAETLDVYGHVLDADYALAVVLAEEDGVPVEGSFGLTVFRNPRAGQFVWADADGDRTFAGRHEADAGFLILCPGIGLPATDTDQRSAVPQLATSRGGLTALFGVAGAFAGLMVAAGCMRRCRIATRVEDTTSCASDADGQRYPSSALRARRGGDLREHSPGSADDPDRHPGAPYSPADRCLRPGASASHASYVTVTPWRFT